MVINIKYISKIYLIIDINFDNTICTLLNLEFKTYLIVLFLYSEQTEVIQNSPIPSGINNENPKLENIDML